LRGEEAKSDLRRHEHELPPAVSPSKEVDNDAAAAASKFTVSRRMVPQGPNPLHNRWEDRSSKLLLLLVWSSAKVESQLMV
jgi:hypothetical protein